MNKRFGDEKKVKSILRTHFVNEKAFEHMRKDDFDNFVIEREKEMKIHLIHLLNLE